MIELIEQSLTWDKLGNHPREDFKYTIKNPTFSKEDGSLKVSLHLNFVMPFLDGEKLKVLIMTVVPGLCKVNFDYIYENIIQSPEEIVGLVIENLLLSPSKRNPWLNSIKGDMFKLDEDAKTLEIQALGINATENLNKTTAKTLCKALKTKFGLDYNILFVNNQQLYTEAALKKKEIEKASVLMTPKQIVGKQDASAAKRNGRSISSNRIFGKGALRNPISFEEFNQDVGRVTLEGIIFYIESRSVSKDKELVVMYMTDKKDSICMKLFVTKEDWVNLSKELNQGDYLRVYGEAKFDTYDNITVLMVKSIERGQPKERLDNCEGNKRVELHAHTKMSAMDGLNEASNLVETAAKWGQPAVAITDHGVVQSFPDAANTASNLKKKGKEIKVIYGLEGYLFDDEDCKNPDGTIDHKKKNTNHIILLAKNQEGLKNIYKLVSISHLKYFYKKPRLPKSVINAHRDGIIVGSACEAGEVFRGVVEGKSTEDIAKIAEFYDYLEIQPIINNRFLMDKGIAKNKEELRNYNKKVLEVGDFLGKPVVATTDAHYDEPESAIFRNILMAGMGYKDAERGQGLYMRTTEEMLEEFSYLGDRAYEVVVENTNKISEQIEEIRPVPEGKFPPKIEGAEETLRESCLKKAHDIYGDPLPEVIRERLEKELDSIIGNGYAVMYVAAKMLVDKSMKDGYLVGSRGSVGSSFAATMAGITEVNPLEPHYICPNCKYLEWGDMNLYDCGIDMPEKKCPQCGETLNRDGFTIPFATFLGFKGDKEPDIDLNFAGEYQAKAHKYVGEIFGEENVFKAGTVGTVADKTAFGYVKKFFEETRRPINKYELQRLSQSCTGVKKTTGQHPGGIIIVPKGHEIYEFCPVQHPANDNSTGIVTTHFDYHKIDQNLLKLDILGHTVPSIIRHLQDMTGINPINVPLTDPKVLSIFNGTEALNIKDEDYTGVHGSYAIPEFGTSFVRQMLDDTKPDKFADLVRISGFSHGTDVWLNNAKDYIKSGVATMREVISTRDDIMNYLILKGLENKRAFDIMEKVRKNKTLSEEELKIMYDHGVPQWYVDSCIKIKYMFPRAHAVAYVMMAMRMAWYKVYYPVEFYATYLSSVVADFDSISCLKGKHAVTEKIKEITEKGKLATKKEENQLLVLEVVYEMMARGYDFKAPILGKSTANKFLVDEGKVLLPYIAVEGVGENAAKAFDEEYKRKPYETIEEAVSRAKLTKIALGGLKSLGVFGDMPETDQLSLF